MHLARCFTALALFSLVNASHAAAAKETGAKPEAGKTALPEKVASVEGITEYRLPNGLRVLLFPDPSKETVTVNITYLVGSRHEGYGETGMAHLLEHMVFKGTPKHPNVPQELTSHGARPNGTTWFDRTNYFETCKATDENLEWALELEADRMVNSFIAKKDLDTEMTVVRNEFEMGENDPFSILEERVMSTAYLWHNYGNSTIGARADLENVPIERLQAFYKTYYQPDNAVLLVAGRFDEAKTLGLIAKHYGPIPRPARALFQTYTRDPAQDGERHVILRRVGDVQGLAIGYHGPPAAHPDSSAVELLNFVLADTPSGRLYRALVDGKKAANVRGGLFQLRDPGYLLFLAEVRQEQSLDEAHKVALSVIDELAQKPITKEELDRARASALKNIELSLTQADRVGINLSEWIGAGDWRLFFIRRDRIKAVTLADVNRAALAYLKATNRTTGHFIPTKAPDRVEIPASPDLDALVRDYKSSEVVALGEAFDPSPANVESRVQRSKLASGLKVALLPKKTRGSSVVVTLVLRHGDEKSLFGKAVIADLTADMLMRGTAKKTRQQIADEWNALKTRVSLSGGPGQWTATLETKAEMLPGALKLLAEVLRGAAFPADELETLRQENLSSIEKQKGEPQPLASQAYGRHVQPYPKGDVRCTATLEDMAADYTAATLDDVKKYYAAFQGASAGEVVVVGDFDPGAVKKLLGDTLGSWKSKSSFKRVPRELKAVPSVNLSIETPDKANAFFLVGHNFAMRDDDADFAAMTLANYMMGGGFLNSRLAVRIRQKEGLSYGVGSGFNASPLDTLGTFTGYAIYAPENLARLEAAFNEEVARVLKDGFEQKELDEARKGWLQSRQLARAQDAGLARQLATHLFVGRTMDFDARVEKAVGELTTERVHAAMRKWVDPAKLSYVKAGDFAKKAAPATKN